MEDNRNIQGGNERLSGSTENSKMDQTGQQQSTSGQQQQNNVGEGANPQDGSQWNNYRERELGSNKSSSDQGSNV